MQALQFWSTVVADHTDFLGRLLGGLATRGVRYCVLGGQGVNAYVDPVVSLDLNLIVAVDQMGVVEEWLDQQFHVERFQHSLNVSAQGSDLRVQLQTDPRYAPFVERAEVREVLGLKLPVARLEVSCKARFGQYSIPDADQVSAKRTSRILPGSLRPTQNYEPSFLTKY